VEGIQVHANEGGVTQTRGGIYWVILPAGCNAFLPYFSVNAMRDNFLSSFTIRDLWITIL